MFLKKIPIILEHVKKQLERKVMSQEYAKSIKTKCEKNENNNIMITYLYSLTAPTYMKLNFYLVA